MLPIWCRYKVGEDERKDLSKQKMWQTRLGSESWLHLHHFCHGLNHYIRVERGVFRSKQEVAYELDRAIKEMSHSIESELSKDIPIRAELFNYLGMAMLAQLQRTKSGSTEEAAATFHKAIAFQPGFTPPYVTLADFYVKTGLNNKAFELLSQGLMISPSDRLLRSRMAKLGGKVPEVLDPPLIPPTPEE